MAVIYPDLNPVNPSATSNAKSTFVKSVKYTFADFTTGGTLSNKLVIPADATILFLSFWKKTQFTGGGVTAVTLSLGVTGALTQYLNAVDVLTPAVGTTTIPIVSNIHQPYNIPWGVDYNMYSTGTATTGNPTAGEIYMDVYYVR